jgi:1-acyl-sn-glycerol-3-phosphate acyltransferase
LRFFAKDSLKWLPGYGWALALNGSILLKRNVWETLTSLATLVFSDAENHLLFTFSSGTKTKRPLSARSVIFATQRFLYGSARSSKARD